MATYLLTWNPKYADAWRRQYRDLATVRRTGSVRTSWSCGHTKRIAAGDRLFLFRQGIEPRGILASGYATGKPYPARHWNKDRPNDTCLFVPLRFEAVLDPGVDGVLPLSVLTSSKPTSAVNWRTQASGIVIEEGAATAIEAHWARILTRINALRLSYPDEVASNLSYQEGAVRRVTINAYERDPEARDACINEHGIRCVICRFDFEAQYGNIGRGFIHVHHLMPLSELKRRYEIDPRTDLRPVCPNCHAMLHRGDEVLSIEELKRRMRTARGVRKSIPPRSA